MFRDAISQVLKSHDYNIVPIIYPVKKKGPFGDETERLEDVIGLQIDQIPMPAIASIHPATASNSIFPHQLMDIDSISPQVIGYWAIKTLLEKDLEHLVTQNQELALKLEVADAGQGMHTLSDAARKKLMVEYGLNKQSIQTVSGQLAQVTEVYDKAVNTAMWEKRFKGEGIETEEQKREYVERY